ncbi:MAG: hypothetical protein HDT26_01640 [Subdoligranulum sp.]|nr:hypothetical protein [Subdoligranulum sp.]
MAYHDYYMRQIEDMGRMLGEILFMKVQAPIPDFDEQGNLLESGLLYRRLCTMLDARDVNGAENLLFEMLERYPEYDFLRVALQFYTDLEKWTDAELKEADFSRQEILEGMREIQKYIDARQNVRSDALRGDG